MCDDSTFQVTTQANYNSSLPKISIISIVNQCDTLHFAQDQSTLNAEVGLVGYTLECKTNQSHQVTSTAD